MGLTSDDIQALLEAFETSSWQEMTIELNGDRLHVSRRAEASLQPAVPATDPLLIPEPSPAPPVSLVTAPPPAVTPIATATDAAGTGRGVPVTAPSVGLFWRSPSPGEPPFVEVGSRTERDDTIAIIEVMKLMSPLTAGVSGVVTAILVENGAMVARGQPLVLVDTDA